MAAWEARSCFLRQSVLPRSCRNMRRSDALSGATALALLVCAIFVYVAVPSFALKPEFGFGAFSVADVPDCRVTECYGPVIATYEGLDCNKNAKTYVRMVLDTVTGYSGGECLNKRGSAVFYSQNWTCSYNSRPYLGRGLTVNTWSLESCAKYSNNPAWKEPSGQFSANVGQCFNAYTNDDPNPNTARKPFSYAFFCSDRDLSRVQVAAPTTKKSPTGLGLTLGREFLQCGRPGCASNTPQVSFFSDSSCSTQPLRSFAVYENLYHVSPNSPSTCFARPTNSTNPSINIPLSASYSCSSDKKTISVSSFADGCSGQANQTVYQSSFSTSSCYASAANSEFFRFSCT